MQCDWLPSAAEIDHWERQAMNGEIERLRAALMRVQNFPSHPGGRADDKSDEADDAPSWRDGWCHAVLAIQATALPGEVKNG